MSSAAPADVRFVIQAGDDIDAKASGGSGPCASDLSPASDIGTVCNDGSVYVGDAPSDGTDLYAAGADEGTHHWTNYPPDSTTTGVTDRADGYANTQSLLGKTNDDGDQRHPAAEACAAKTTGGHSDWYLPAIDELNMVADMYGSIGLQDSQYYSSTEANADDAYENDVAADDEGTTNKDYYDFPIRCVRREGA